MNAKITIEGEFSISKILSILSTITVSRSCINQDSWTFNFLGLIGVKDRNLIERAI